VRTDEKFSRQVGIVNPDDIRNEAVLVIGAGAIGSWTTLALARVGYNDITVYDNDTVDEVNLATQFFRSCDVKRPKVNALAEGINSYCDLEIDTHNELYDGQEFRSIVISCVDSMQARHDIWKHIKMKPNVNCYIDARMGGVNMNIYTICPTDMDDIALYEECLWPPEEVVHVDCSRKAICYNVNTISSFVVNNLIKCILKGTHDREILFNMDDMSLFRK
jgi:molybdopterin/thiamine biosynthesis adenylyltransferase